MNPNRNLGVTTHFSEIIKLQINSAFEIHRQVKTNDIRFRRFGDVMTPFNYVNLRSNSIELAYIIHSLRINGVMTSPKRQNLISLVFTFL